ncbi:MAG: rhomboid family intramembrane serine protease [Candidatus Bathyarchaeota archaeon]|nr:rhomboid family intramembrane serine protease [Candidatus Termiticorpusculum sp.]
MMIFLLPKSSQNHKITYILIALNITFYIYGAIVGGNAFVTGKNVIDVLGQNNALVLAHGFYHQLFTSMFIHASIVHLGSNLIFLLIFGLRAEEMFSLPEYLGIYFLGGLAGNLLSLAYGPGYISVGASGAIFAIFGACVIYDRKSTQRSIITALAFALLLLVINIGENVNILAHAGGLAFGLIIGYLLALKHKTTNQKQYALNYSYTYST